MPGPPASTLAETKPQPDAGPTQQWLLYTHSFIAHHALGTNMSDTPTSLIVDQYQTIAGITRHMLELAQTGRWDDVVEQSKQYRHAVEQLKSLEDLSVMDKQARRQLLTQILEDDAQIRHLATPELDRLSALLGNMKRQQTVLQAYYSPSVHP